MKKTILLLAIGTLTLLSCTKDDIIAEKEITGEAREQAILKGWVLKSAISPTAIDINGDGIKNKDLLNGDSPEIRDCSRDDVHFFSKGGEYLIIEGSKGCDGRLPDSQVFKDTYELIDNYSIIKFKSYPTYYILKLTEEELEVEILANVANESEPVKIKFIYSTK